VVTEDGDEVMGVDMINIAIHVTLGLEEKG
jgi:hypothetical protein